MAIYDSFIYAKIEGKHREDEITSQSCCNSNLTGSDRVLLLSPNTSTPRSLRVSSKLRFTLDVEDRLHSYKLYTSQGLAQLDWMRENSTGSSSAEKWGWNHDIFLGRRMTRATTILTQRTHTCPPPPLFTLSFKVTYIIYAKDTELDQQGLTGSIFRL